METVSASRRVRVKRMTSRQLKPDFHPAKRAQPCPCVSTVASFASQSTHRLCVACVAYDGNRASMTSFVVYAVVAAATDA